MELPAFYYFRQDIYEDRIPPACLDEVVEAWKPSPDIERLLPIAGWSNDWSNFENMDEWIQPYSRWGTTDNTFRFDNFSPAILLIRLRLDALGDVIPILYKEDNHEIVLFRIGQRPYIRSISPTEDERFGAVPLPLHQVLDAVVLDGFIEDFSLMDSLRTFRVWDGAVGYQAIIRYICLQILQYLSSPDAGYRPAGEPETWTDDDWIRIHEDYHTYRRSR